MSSTEKPAAKRRTSFVVAMTGLAWTAIVAVGVFTALVIVSLFNDDLSMMWVAIGLVVSSAGVAVAGAVFVQQHRAAEDASRGFAEIISALDSNVSQGFEVVGRDMQEVKGNQVKILETSHTLGLKVPLDEPERALSLEEADGDDIDTDALPDGIFAHGEKPERLYEPSAVPLYVVADLVWGWRRNAAEPPTSRRWLVGQLVGASRATGQGNNPWIVTFLDRDEKRRIYRLFRGGKGQSKPSVREITDDVIGDDSTR